MGSNDNNIEIYFHCGKCMDEGIPKGESPKTHQRIQAGWTIEGIQVWCVRHECNIIHIDFEGTKHPADTSIPKEEA